MIVLRQKEFGNKENKLLKRAFEKKVGSRNIHGQKLREKTKELLEKHPDLSAQTDDWTYRNWGVYNKAGDAALVSAGRKVLRKPALIDPYAPPLEIRLHKLENKISTATPSSEIWKKMTTKEKQRVSKMLERKKNNAKT